MEVIVRSFANRRGIAQATADTFLELLSKELKPHDLPHISAVGFCDCFQQRAIGIVLTQSLIQHKMEGLVANQFCCSLRSNLSHPPPWKEIKGGLLYRGGSLPPEYIPWFRAMIGRQYRCPQYFATSLLPSVTLPFKCQNDPVRWVIEIPDLTQPVADWTRFIRDPPCAHVNYLDHISLVPGEMLFPPYSIFTVKSVQVPAEIVLFCLLYG